MKISNNLKKNFVVIFLFVIFLLSGNLVIAQSDSERLQYLLNGQPKLDPQLESVNKQIEDLRRNQPVRSTWSESSDVQGNILAEQKANKSKKLGYVLAGIWIIIMAGSWLYNYTRPKNIEGRRKMREIRKHELKLEQQEKLRTIEKEEEMRKMVQQTKKEEKESLKKEELSKYQQLRKEIESMPEYEHWRQVVFKERGKKCSKCGSTENLEIDHRFKSFYSIIKEYGITNTIQAYECAALWSVDNGAPLCKTHHDETTSSVYRQLKQ